MLDFVSQSGWPNDKQNNLIKFKYQFRKNISSMKFVNTCKWVLFHDLNYFSWNIQFHQMYVTCIQKATINNWNQKNDSKKCFPLVIK